MTRPSFIPVKLHGLILDLDPEDVPADKWTNGRNVFFKAGEAIRCDPINPIFGAELFAVEISWYVDTGAQEWWYYASSAGVGVTDGAGNHYNVTPVGWVPIVTKNFVFSAGDLNTLPWINHPELGPFWHDGDPAHKFEKLPDWPASWSCFWMASHKNFLMAINIDTGAGLAESQVSWSSSADPGQVPDHWVPAPDNDAGDMTFATPGGPLVGGISIRDQFFVMKADATFAMQYVGGQWVFQSRDVFPSLGLYGPNSCVENDNLVYMLTGHGEFVRHDGNSVQNLLYGIAQDYLSRTMNAEWTSSPFCYMTDNNAVVALAYPTTAARACTEALGIELASVGRDQPSDLGLRDLPGVYGASYGYTEISAQSWDTAVGVWDTDTMRWNEQPSGYRPPQVVFSGGVNGMLQLGQGTGVLGVAIEAFVERLGYDFGDFSTHKVMSGAFPRLQGNDGDVIYFRFGGQEQVRSAVSWGTEIAYTMGVSSQLDFFQDGRLAAFSMRSSGGQSWSSNGLQVMVRKAGRW